MDSKIVVWLRRNVKWKKWTDYHKTHLVHLTDTDYGRLYTHHGQDYLMNSEGEVGKIPYFVSLTLKDVDRVTQQWGPYNFHNGFESTREAEYLKKMFLKY